MTTKNDQKPNPVFLETKTHLTKLREGIEKDMKEDPDPSFRQEANVLLDIINETVHKIDVYQKNDKYDARTEIECMVTMIGVVNFIAGADPFIEDEYDDEDFDDEEDFDDDEDFDEDEDFDDFEDEESDILTIENEK